MKWLICALAIALAVGASLVTSAQGTAFTYQGVLADNGAPASGAYDLQFTVFGQDTGGAPIAGPLEKGDVTVASGRFAVTLDFGGATFPGAGRWLEIGVRPGASTGAYTVLSPRQPMTAAPYAITSGSVTGAINGNQITAGSITGGQLAAGAASANLAAGGQSGVASGGILLSATESASLVAAGYVKIGTTQLNDLWQLRSSISAADGRNFHSTVWTGTEMIVWGGTNENGPLNTGARYDPVADVWTPVSTANAPAARQEHAAVWTGTEMIVWGGWDGNTFMNTGGRYDPATDTWTALPTTNAASARSDHTAVWTGTEMIVWGGGDGINILNTGGRYNPGTNTWSAGGTAAANAPAPRYAHTAVWTGAEMIVWGGLSSGSVNTGGRYNPANNTWTAGGTTTAGAPSGRNTHSAVWTGTDMIVWGGQANATYFNDGGRYRPATNTWANGGTTTVGAPSGRTRHTAVWTDTEMIVWGGLDNSSTLNSGGRYNPTANTWSAVTLNGAATARQLHSAVWTGREMIVWGGFSFSTFNDTWAYIPGRTMFLYQKP